MGARDRNGDDVTNAATRAMSSVAVLSLAVLLAGCDRAATQGGVELTDAARSDSRITVAPAPAPQTPPADVGTPTAGTANAVGAGDAGHGTRTGGFAGSIFGNVVSDTSRQTLTSRGIEMGVLEQAAEISLADGRVERSYRVHFTNRGDAALSLQATFDSTNPRIEIVNGAINIGDLGAGESVTPFGTLIVRHDPNEPLRPEMLTLQVQETDAGTGSGGTLLSGARSTPASAAVRAYSESTESAAPGLQLGAVLSGNATVGEVNDALRRSMARIVAMRPGSQLLTLRIPWSGDKALAERQIESLRDSGMFENVRPIAAPGQATDALGLPPAPVPDPEPEFNDHKDV